MDKGPWFFPAYQHNDGPNEGNPDVENKTDYIESDDPKYDAILCADGDFANNTERRKYLEFIAGELNAVSSLRAALLAKEEAERFVMDVQAGCDITRNGVLYRQVRVVIGPGRTADFIRAEEAERKVCAMREALDRSDMRNDISIACFEAGHKSENNLIDSIVDAVRQPLEAALSSSAPCRHKAEADALREEVKGLKDLALIRCPVCGSESAGSNEMAINKELYALRKAVEWIAATLMDEKHWGEVSNADIVAELRRIAGGVK